jgi:hypothetical protein
LRKTRNRKSKAKKKESQQPILLLYHRFSFVTWIIKGVTSIHGRQISITQKKETSNLKYTGKTAIFQAGHTSVSYSINADKQ